MFNFTKNRRLIDHSNEQDVIEWERNKAIRICSSIIIFKCRPKVCENVLSIGFYQLRMANLYAELIDP